MGFSPPSMHPRDSNLVRVTLHPSGKVLQVARGASLREILFEQGLEFPCGGHGRCKGCRVRVLEGQVAPSEWGRRLLSEEERQEGWRLACQARAETDLTLELADWEGPILADGTPFEFDPEPGWGVAVDVGTTTLVAQAVDLTSGKVQGVQSALNNQSCHGADIMSRIEFAVAGGQNELTRLIRQQVGSMVVALMENAAEAGWKGPPRRVVLVGNTVMHHLFGGLSVTPLAQHPFLPADLGPLSFSLQDLDWSWQGTVSGTSGPGESSPEICFLPCLGGFVGSDLLAGILATRLMDSERPVALVDLGTNGEMVIGNRERVVCASTAAGPAFEGARISMGMRAVHGAIAEVATENGRLRCRVLGHGPARGLCGSGLVDAVAAGLALGWIESNGRMTMGPMFTLSGKVHLHQCDVRELQLAKGAIAAGLRLLAQRWGTNVESIHRVYLAGAFGNYINLDSARRIGLLPFPDERVEPAGNAALRGAKLALFGGGLERWQFSDLRPRVEHVSLNEDPSFHEVYAEAMGFPMV